jgi:hypothetical protein
MNSRIAKNGEIYLLELEGGKQIPLYGYMTYQPKKARYEDFKEIGVQLFFCAVYAKLRENPLRNDLEAEKKATEAKYIEYRRDHSVKQSRRAGAGKGASAEGSASIGYCMGEKVALSRPCGNRGESVRAIGAEAV